jgi:hypothetical protein
MSSGMRMCRHSAYNATATGELRRSHVPAATLSELAHAVTPRAARRAAPVPRLAIVPKRAVTGGGGKHEERHRNEHHEDAAHETHRALGQVHSEQHVLGHVT